MENTQFRGHSPYLPRARRAHRVSEIKIVSPKLCARIGGGGVNEICAERGFSNLEWKPTNFELLNDFGAVKLEGVSCFTLTDFKGQLEKYYNKPGVRREVRYSQMPIPLSSLIALISGGLPSYHSNLDFLELNNRVGNLEQSQKYQSSLLSKILSLLSKFISQSI